MARNATVEIATDCDNVLTFLQAVALKATQLVAAPLLLRADKRAQLVPPVGESPSHTTPYPSQECAAGSHRSHESPK